MGDYFKLFPKLARDCEKLVSVPTSILVKYEQWLVDFEWRIYGLWH